MARARRSRTVPGQADDRERTVLFALAGALLVAAAAPAKTPKTVKAGKFEVVDADGKTRAFLGMTETGGVGLRILNRAGTRRLQAEMESSGAAGFVIFSAQGQPGVLLIRSSKGIPSLMFADEKRRPLTILNRTDTGAAFIMRDANGKNRVGLNITPGHAGLFLNGEDGKIHMAQAVLKNGSPVVKMTDKDGKTIWSLPEAKAEKQ